MKSSLLFAVKSFAFSVIFSITIVLVSIPIIKMRESMEAKSQAAQVASRQKAREEAQEQAQQKAAAQEADEKKQAERLKEWWKRSDEQFDRNDAYAAQLEALIKRQAAVVQLQEINAKREAAVLAEQARRLGLSDKKE
jgi:heme exporter protein D